MKNNNKKSFFKVAASGVHGNFTFVMAVWEIEDLIPAAYQILGVNVKIKGEPKKTTEKIIKGLNPFCKVNKAYCIY